MTDQTPATEAVSHPVHEPHCNERCTHYLEGSGSVRSDAGRVQERVPGVVRSQARQGAPTDPDPPRFRATDDADWYGVLTPEQIADYRATILRERQP